MILSYSTTSPYSRKVRVLAIEVGIDGRIELSALKLSPIRPHPDLARVNPLMKVPALLTGDGLALYDSKVICEYLDSLHDGPRMIPGDSARRWIVLRRQALCDGMLEAMQACGQEGSLRPEPLRWPAWVDGQTAKIMSGLEQLESELDDIAADLTLATIAAGCALGFLEFRLPEMGWRDEVPRLAAWYDGFAQRESMRQTAPSS